ncbi:hypothetical protein [Dyadobacter psychrotolerans]|uniref:Uncharacterized protein n=1 Tax=Dyadobacter psychrotolerans TaxID=2541721 RepID=A0A4R5DWB0_9BACT|nr:hypothetical protein [Dyadobacter psychrotolerans]TDE15313.1 hypothetical protein E0F88_12380 [Dyadobacter psychrotolerans]
MTALILYVLLWLWDNQNFDSITRANERKLGAEKSFEDKKYLDAAKLYYQITYGSIFSDPAARLNLAHAYFLAGKHDLALKYYRQLRRVDDKTLASIANAQIALIQVGKQDTATALVNLKTALRLEPGNDLARHNYIILKKNFSGIEKPTETKITKKHQNNQTTSNAPAAAKEENLQVEQDVKREQLLQSLKEMNMSEDQARAILDAMKSNESQYIYQLRRKQYAKKPEQKDQIEW